VMTGVKLLIDQDVHVTRRSASHLGPGLLSEQERSGRVYTHRLAEDF
jgi:hypothetical protein